MKPKVHPEPVEGLSPRQVKTQKQELELRQGDFEKPDYWILVSSRTVILCRQRTNHPTEQKIVIAKDDFDQMIDWYNKPQ